MWLLIVSVASAQLLAQRYILNEQVAAVNELLTVRYTVTSHADLSNVQLYDASFSSTNFRFLEGRTQAVISFDTIRQGQTVTKDLELMPTAMGEVQLLGLTLSFTRQDQSFGQITLDNKDSLSVISQDDFRMRSNWEPLEVGLLAGLVLLSSAVPLGYSAYLRLKRFFDLKKAN
jgi:hypothetical protein